MTNEEKATTITVAEVKALLAFASHKDMRPNMEGICISSGPLGARFGATDGRTLAVRGFDPRAKWVGKAVPSTLWKLVIKGAKAADLVTWKIDGEAVELSCRGITVYGELLAGPFPPAHGVIPPEDRDPVPCIHLNADAYLSRLELVGSAVRSVVGSLKSAAWAMRIGGELDPILLSLDVPGSALWTVVIMPMRM